MLLADDSADAAQIAALLEQLGVRCDHVRDGALAIAAVAGTRYDAVLIALDMAVLDGVTAAPVMRAIGYKGPLIALAAAGAGQEPSGARPHAHQPFSLVLNKPRDPALLGELVQQALRHAVRAGASGLVDSGRLGLDLADSAGEARMTPLPHSDTGFESLPAFAGFRTNFRAALGARLAELRSAAASADWHTVARQAHTLKGSGGTFGFPGVSECATAIELGALAGDAAAVEAALGRLQTHAAFLNRPHQQ